MRIAFVEDILRFSIPLGIAGIAASLREGGHAVRVSVVTKDLDRTLDELADWKPDAIAFSVISGSHRGYYEIARRAKERLGVLTLWGGPHPTFFPEIIELPWVDAVCIGEGEEAVCALADEFDALGALPAEVPNFWIKTGGAVHRNPVRPRNRQLDDLPWAARDLYYEQFPIIRRHGIKHFLAHRGCPYKCTYCFNDSYNSIYREQAGDKKVFSSRSPDSIVDEILDLRERVPVRMVAFVDDVFTLHRRWTMEFAEVYARRCGIPFSINARFDNVDEEMVLALKAAGLSLVYAGVEGGDEYIRNTVMKRNMTEESMYAAAELYKKSNVKLLTENVVGNPGETYEMAKRTLAINIRLKPDIANASVFAPYPKLAMTQYAIDGGWFDGNFDSLNSNYYHGTVLKFPTDRDARRIVNLRCFFSFLSHFPRFLPVVEPLLDLRPNVAFRWFGDLVDGFYLKRCVAYKLGWGDFITTLRHYLTNYRQGSTAGRTAEARNLIAEAGQAVDRTQSPVVPV
ncbi:MAG: B12-binding domain-containing radical SAM protein [Candidatus Eisenbacteria bacterium]|nr:B12-binding domain-containing radical SAM protein [Candidatus Eisenbacteria bacterium]